MIISLINQKGGVGKTTLSVSIAHQLARTTSSEEILLVDADPQHSALSWSEVREGKLPFAVIGFPKKTLHRDLPVIAKNYKHVIIDAPPGAPDPRATELVRSCIMASDLVLIPCTPSPYDVWSSNKTVDLIIEAHIYKQKLKGAFVINRKILNTAIARDVTDALKKMQLSVLDSCITQRVMFPESAATGKTVFDIEADSKGANEIIKLVDEILFTFDYLEIKND